MTVKIKPGLYITSKTLRLIDEDVYAQFRQRVRDRGYTAHRDYGVYEGPAFVENLEAILLDGEGDLVWTTIVYARECDGAYELTHQDIMRLVNNKSNDKKSKSIPQNMMSADMTMRDYFAGIALNKIFSNLIQQHALHDVAKRSYEMADEMLKARSK